jgi:hypothetical protein
MAKGLIGTMTPLFPMALSMRQSMLNQVITSLTFIIVDCITIFEFMGMVVIII